MTDLKPCPFCGGTFVAQGASNDRIAVWCGDCGARGPDVKFPEDCMPGPPIDECRAAWNRRALSSLPEAPAAGVDWASEPKFDWNNTDGPARQRHVGQHKEWAEDQIERLRSALLSSPPAKTAAVDGEVVKAASVAVLDILNTEAIVHPKEPSAKRLAERIACAALASQAAVEEAVVTLSRMGWEEQVEGGKLFTATAVFSEPPPWSADVVWKSAPFSLSLAAKRRQGE